MILFDRGAQRLRYSTRRADNGGWIVAENERAIAFTDSQVYAAAIAQALNLVQLLTTLGLRPTGKPRRPELN